MTSRLLIAASLAAASAVLAGLGCGGESAGCCSSTIRIPAATSYRASLANPDGGAPTQATLVRLEDGGVVITFNDGSSVVELRGELVPY